MKNNLIHLKVSVVFIIIFLLFTISACQKVINIDLNTASPNIVIEGIIDNSQGPYRVKLSKTGSYFNQPVLPPVSGAQVIISDNIGTIDTLTEDSTGLYFTHKIKGIPGRSYNLNVLSEKVSYTASSTMMDAVYIDSLGLEIVQRISFGARNRRDSSLNIYFKDPPDQKNFYRIKFYENNVFHSTNYRLYDDEYTNGEEISLNVGHAVIGDTDKIELISLDRATYDYYRTLRDILDINPIFGSTPANPNTNLSQGALGYFAALAITTKTLILYSK